jgi:hypothetical protein
MMEACAHGTFGSALEQVSSNTEARIDSEETQVTLLFKGGRLNQPCLLASRKQDGQRVVTMIDERLNSAQAVVTDPTSVGIWGMTARLEADKVVWPDGVAWSNPTGRLVGVFYNLGIHTSPCLVFTCRSCDGNRCDQGLILVDEKRKVARAHFINGSNEFVVPDWGNIKGRFSEYGFRIEWPAGFWLAVPNPEGNWYNKGLMNQKCDVQLYFTADGPRLRFKDENGLEADGYFVSDLEFAVPSWKATGRIESRLLWQDGRAGNNWSGHWARHVGE